MSDELDSLDASEKAAVEDALNTRSGRQMTSCRQRRRSVDIRKPAFAQTSQAFAFAGRRISICRAAMTPEQEKAALDRLRPLQRWVAGPGPSLPAAVGAINAQLRADKQQLKGARRKGLARA